MTAASVASLADMRAAVEERRRQEAESLPEPPAKEKDGGGSGELPPDFIDTCLRNNERGDGVLLAAIARGRIVYVKRTGRWLWWNGVHWEDDKKDLAHAMVEEVARVYLVHAEKSSEEVTTLRKRKKDAEDAALAETNAGDIEAAAANADKAKQLGLAIAGIIEKRKALMRRIDRLRSTRGAKNCLEWSHKIGPDSLAIIGDEIDQMPWLLPCQNGIVDLKTGRIMPGNPCDYLVTAVPYDFPDCQDYLRSGEGYTFAPWTDFISEIHRGDPNLVDFIHRLFGYSITGHSNQHFIAAFVGDGRNGKGTMFETIKSALGDFAWSIQPEMIIEQKNARSSAGPSADLMSLFGKRFVIASETDAGQRISGARVKRLTGADTIAARSPHDRFEINFKPNHTLFLYTNDIPSGMTKDFAMLQRLLLVKYPLRYVPDPEEKAAKDPQNAHIYRKMDKDLPERLMGGIPWILAWLVRGCLLWQRDGLAPPDSIKADIEKHAMSEDYLAQFIHSACDTTDPLASLKLSDFYGYFKKWYIANIDDRGRFIPTNNAVGRALQKKGFKKNETGDRKYYGISVIDQEVLYGNG